MVRKYQINCLPKIILMKLLTTEKTRNQSTTDILSINSTTLQNGIRKTMNEDKMVFQEKCTIVAFLGKLAWDVYGTGFAVIG
jgi:hypothetical protein